MTGPQVANSSFRDPTGFVFTRDGILYRQVNAGHEEGLESLIASGLQDDLERGGLAVSFGRVGLDLAASPLAGAVIQPDLIPFVSYPYEWSFGQLKDAALLTLEIMRRSLEKGLWLKDASAYNVQFIGCRPIFIDTLSFEPYPEGQPWVAYKQFCQHFLAPLALMAHVDVRLSTLLRVHLDGIPLDLASELLPGKTKLNAGLLTHIHLHAKAQGTAGNDVKRKVSISKTSLLALVDSLKGAVSGLNWKPSGTEWSDYYSETNYSKESFSRKGEIVSEFLTKVPAEAKTCWDLGANTGEFSHLAVTRGLTTIAWDIDPAAVEKAYQDGKACRDANLLPLLQDLRNPSTNLGWGGRERDSLESRAPADVLLALALVHHLAIGNNVPLPMVADYFARLGRWVILEFVPKEDSQVQRMLVARKDVFGGYDQVGLESAFSEYFEVMARTPIEGTARTLYLFQRK